MEPKSKNMASWKCCLFVYVHTHTQNKCKTTPQKSVHSCTGPTPEARVSCLRKPQLQSKLTHAAQLQQTPMGLHTAEVGSTETAKARGGTMHFCCKAKKKKKSRCSRLKHTDIGTNFQYKAKNCRNTYILHRLFSCCAILRRVHEKYRAWGSPYTDSLKTKNHRPPEWQKREVENGDDHHRHIS